MKIVGLEERPARLNAVRNLKMARSAHAYVRGSTTRFYQWLEASGSSIPQGPAVWICGDCHVGNLGPLADAKGRVAVQIRDLDQTVVGNPVHDLIRLGLSLASAARGSDLPGVTTARIIEQLIAGYEAALSSDFGKPWDKGHRPDSVRRLLALSVRRRWRHLAAERLATVKPKLPLGAKFWALSADERAGLEAVFAQPHVREMVGGLGAGDVSRRVEMIDAAYWMKGCSSLGRLRYAAMLRVGEGPDASLCLIDLKEAVTAAAPRSADAAMPRDNAARVVAGAQALSPHLGQRMVASRLSGKPMVLRELMPQDLKIEVGRLTPQTATELAAYLAGVVGRAHGRQLDQAGRDAWLRDLARARSATLDAPSWLWASIVDLLSIHEAAYLEHCRRYALAHAA